MTDQTPYQKDLVVFEAIEARRGDGASNLARLLAEEAIDELDGESRGEDRVYYLARWFDAVIRQSTGA